MASVYSGQYWTGSYTYTRVRVDYSGTSATAVLLYTRTNAYSGATYESHLTFSFGGSSTTVSATKYGQMTDAEIARVSFSISTNGGTYSGSATGSAGTYFNFSGSVSIPSQVTSPSAPSVGNTTTAGPDWYTANVSISSWGTGGSSAQRYRELQIWTYSDSGLVTPRAYTSQYGSALSGVITVDNESNRSPYSTLTLVPNTRYVVGAFATNGAANSGSIRQGEHDTAPPIMSSEIDSVTDSSVGVRWSFPNQGGAGDLRVQYSLDGSTWNTVETTTGSGAKSGSYTISGLSPGTTYNIQTRLYRTNERWDYITNGNTLAVTVGGTDNLYCSVDNKTKKVKKLYASVNEQTKEIKHLYCSVDNKTKRIF